MALRHRHEREGRSFPGWLFSGRFPGGLTRDRRGVAALEFALVAGPFMVMMFCFIATSAVFQTWSSMQNYAQYAARVMSTGQIKNFSNGAITAGNASSTVTCSGSLNNTQVEYYACNGLPTWATFTVTATQNCATPSVTINISVSAAGVAISDIFAMFAGKTLTATSVMMKEGLCP